MDTIEYLRRLETLVATKPGMYLRLLHGRKDPEQHMDDWGDDGPMFGPLKWVHITYNSTINICAADCADDSVWESGTGPMGHADPMYFYEDMLYYDGVYYGDWELEVRP